MTEKQALTAQQFYEIVAKPTIEEFQQNRLSMRLGYLAALVLHHATEHAFVERVGIDKSMTANKKYWAQPLLALQVIHGVAIATKHGQRDRDSYVLDGKQALPMVGGRFFPGHSFWGDTEGGLMVRIRGGSHAVVRLHHAMRDAVERVEADFPELMA